MFEKNWEELEITDNYLFLKVFENKDICKNFISYLLKTDIRDIEYRRQHDEKGIGSSLESKFVKLDIFCETETKAFDVELQAYTQKEDPLPLRARCYQSNKDQIILHNGHHYERLRDLYIIFLSPIDYIKENSAIYTIKNTVLEFPNSKWDEKIIKILLYTKGKAQNLHEDIVKFLNYCKGLPPEGAFTESVAHEVKKIKENENLKEEYMTLSQEIERIKNDWIAYGKTEEKNANIKKLYLKGLSVEKIANLLDDDIHYIKKIVNVQ